MNNIIRLLKNDFTLLDLGSSFAGRNRTMKQFAPAITLIEIDAINPGKVEEDEFNKRIKLQKAVSGRSGKRIFYERNFFLCSSFLEVDNEVATMFGIEEMAKLKQKLELECITVNDLIANEKIEKIDFFKTDLEGLDFEVLKSSQEVVNKALVIQSELRFQPMFIGEPKFTEVCTYLEGLGFELIYIAPEVWKYNTSNRNNFRDGRMVWGDFIFFKKLSTESRKDTQGLVLLLKQIIIAKSLDLHSHAEYLFEKNSSIFPPAIYKELLQLLKPRPGLSLIAIKCINLLARVKGYGLIRNFFKRLSRLFAVDVRSFKWWTSV